MLSKNQVSNLITFYNEEVDDIKKYGSESELVAFKYHFSIFIDCIDCFASFEEDHLVDIEEW